MAEAPNHNPKANPPDKATANPAQGSSAKTPVKTSRYIIAGWIAAGIFALLGIVFTFLNTQPPAGLVAELIALYLASILVWIQLETRHEERRGRGETTGFMLRLAAVLGLIGCLVFELGLLRAFLFGTSESAQIWSAADTAWPLVIGAIGVALVFCFFIVATLYAIVRVIRED